jgi:enoyl-CoA hydratase/carnithine racemase
VSSVDLHIEGPLARVHLNNAAKLNAFTPDMLRQLEAHCDTIEGDVSIRGVLVTAEGERAFCAGADIIGWGALSPTEFARHWVRLGHRVFDRLARLSRPTIAVVQGHAFGGGLELATACDIRVMAPGATLGLPEAQRGHRSGLVRDAASGAAAAGAGAEGNGALRAAAVGGTGVRAGLRGRGGGGPACGGDGDRRRPAQGRAAGP